MDVCSISGGHSSDDGITRTKHFGTVGHSNKHLYSGSLTYKLTCRRTLRRALLRRHLRPTGQKKFNAVITFTLLRCIAALPFAPIPAAAFLAAAALRAGAFITKLFFLAFTSALHYSAPFFTPSCDIAFYFSTRLFR